MQNGWSLSEGFPHTRVKDTTFQKPEGGKDCTEQRKKRNPIKEWGEEIKPDKRQLLWAFRKDGTQSRKPYIYPY